MLISCETFSEQTYHTSITIDKQFLTGLGHPKLTEGGISLKNRALGISNIF